MVEPGSGPPTTGPAWAWSGLSVARSLGAVKLPGAPLLLWGAARGWWAFSTPSSFLAPAPQLLPHCLSLPPSLPTPPPPSPLSPRLASAQGRSEWGARGAAAPAQPRGAQTGSAAAGPAAAGGTGAQRARVRVWGLHRIA